MKKGDIVYIDYDLLIKETDELFETTNEDVARENDIYDEKTLYGPRATIVGEERWIKGLDESFLSANLGKDYEIEIPPENAFGERDPKLVEVKSRREIMRLPEFRKNDLQPVPGMPVTIGEKQGTIASVTAGRVRVDFNHKLAGHTLKYKYKVVEKPKGQEDQIRAIISMNYRIGKEILDEFDIKVKAKKANIILPSSCIYDSNWFIVKYRVVGDLRNALSIDTIDFIERYVKKEEKEEGSKEGEKKEEGKKGGKKVEKEGAEVKEGGKKGEKKVDKEGAEVKEEGKKGEEKKEE